MKEKIAAGEKLLHSFYKEVPLLQLPLKENTLEADIFIDINTPEDLEYAQEYFHKMHEIDTDKVLVHHPHK